MSTPAETPIAPALKKTPLNATHRALKAKMVDFGGWDMPVEYPCPGGGLIAEHLAVRTGVGLFDVSHMGEIQFRGPGALAAVQHITMNDASRLQDGQAHYSALLTPEGTFVDDILVHRLSPNDYLLVVNAGTKERITPGFASRPAHSPPSTSPTTPTTTRSSLFRAPAPWKPLPSSPRSTLLASRIIGSPGALSPAFPTL